VPDSFRGSGLLHNTHTRTHAHTTLPRCSRMLHCARRFFKVRDTEAVERTLFWGILGAMVLRAVVVAIGGGNPSCIPSCIVIMSVHGN